MDRGTPFLWFEDLRAWDSNIYWFSSLHGRFTPSILERIMKQTLKSNTTYIYIYLRVQPLATSYNISVSFENLQQAIFILHIDR